MSHLAQQRLEQEDAEDAAGLAAESQEPLLDDADADAAPTQEDDSDLAAGREVAAASCDDVPMAAAMPLVRSFTLPLLHKTPVSSRSYLRLDAPPTPHTAHDGSSTPSLRSPLRHTTPLSLRTIARLPQLFRFPMNSPSANSVSSMASPSAMSIVSPPPAETAPNATVAASAAPFSSPSSSSSSSSQRQRPQRSFTTVQARPPLTHQHLQKEATAGSLSAKHATEAAAAGVSSSHKRVRSIDAESSAAVEESCVPASAAADVSMCVTPTKSASVIAAATASSAVTEESPLPLSVLEPQIIVGPVIGKVDATSARVLLEINVAARITATLVPQTRWYRPPFDATTGTAAIAQSSPSPISSPQPDDADAGMPRSPIKKQRTGMAADGSAIALNSPLAGGAVHSKTLQLHAFHPTIFAFRDLAPETVYLVTFAPASDSDPAFDPAHLMDRTGMLRTHSTDPACPPNFVAFSCDCASEVGRDKENMWMRLYNEQCVVQPSPSNSSNRPTVFLHIGDQVYADAAFAKGEIILAANFPVETNEAAVGAAAAAATKASNAVSAETPAVDEYADLTLPQKLRLIYEAYAEIYRHTWSDSPTRLVLATHSHVMQLDDHELRNDYGSFVPTPMDHLIASQARKAFHVYQRALWDDEVSVSSSEAYDALELSSLECSFHAFGRVGLLIMDNRSCRTLDPTCSVFPKARYEEERRMMIAAGMEPPPEVVAAAAANPASSLYRPPHAHAYFGAEQWQRLYSYFPPAFSGASPTSASASASASAGVVTDSISVLLVVNPSPAFFLGSVESERLIPQSCLVDKLGLGLHPEEQGCYLRLFERWKYGANAENAMAASASSSDPSLSASTLPRREVLFLGGDSHFGMTSFIWRVDDSLLDSLHPPLSAQSDPRIVGSGSPRGPSYWPIPDHAAVHALFKQVLCSALSSRRPRYSSFMLWKKSLFAKHALHAKPKRREQTQQQQDGSTTAPALLPPPPPYYLTHERLLYAHNFVCITADPTASPPAVQTHYVLSGAHQAELEVRKQQLSGAPKLEASAPSRG